MLGQNGTNGTGSYVGRLKDADRSTDGGKGRNLQNKFGRT